MAWLAFCSPVSHLCFFLFYFFKEATNLPVIPIPVIPILIIPIISIPIIPIPSYYLFQLAY